MKVSWLYRVKRRIIMATDGSFKVVIDGRGHLLGRLASIVAKQILKGQHVTIVRCEDVCLSGGIVRQKEKFVRYLRKRMNTNPKMGPFHFRSPSRMLLKAVRGMIPHKTPRGQEAMKRVKAFEGIPEPYDTMKRMVVPEALRLLRLAPGHKYCVLGTLASEVGWKYFDTIKELEEKRKARAAEFYKKKKELMKERADAAANL